MRIFFLQIQIPITHYRSILKQIVNTYYILSFAITCCNDIVICLKCFNNTLNKVKI